MRKKMGYWFRWFSVGIVGKWEEVNFRNVSMWGFDICIRDWNLFL